MNSSRSRRVRLPAILLVLLISVSCDRPSLPPVPAFEELGFADTLDIVQRQVLAAYEEWQEEPRDAGRNGRLGMLLSAYGKNFASEILYQRARILAPDEFRWMYYLAVAMQESGRYQEAEGLLRQALEIEPEYHEGRLRLARLLLQANDFDQSVAIFRQLTEEFPGRVEGWLGLGKALGRRGDLEAATEALKRARIIGPQYGEVHYAYAVVLAQSGDDERAASEFAAYERTAGNVIYTEDRLIREVIALNAGDGPRMTRADAYMQRGQWRNAATSYRAAVDINPANQNAWGGLVDALARAGEIEQAGEAYREALAAGIDYRRLHLTYGQALRKSQQLDAARDVIARAVELDPRYADALVAIGEVEMERGAGVAAVAHFRNALAVLPNDRHAMLGLATALNTAGEYQEAAARLEPLTSDPAADKAVALKELAIAYHGLDRRNDAIRALQRGREAAPASADKTIADTIDALLAEWGSETSR